METKRRIWSDPPFKNLHQCLSLFLCRLPLLSFPGPFISLCIDVFRKFSELLVRFLFFFERFLQQRGVLRFAKLLCKSSNRSICSNFIMFHALSSPYQCGSSKASSKSSFIISEPSSTKPSIPVHFFPLG